MRAIFPATFDPITNGHLDIATRASVLFDEVVMAVFDRPARKNPLFSLDERVALVKASTERLPNVRVEPFSGLMVAFARQIGAGVVVRGLRTSGDFEAEYPQVLANHELAPEVDVVFLVARGSWSFVSSSLIKEIASLGGDVARFVPPPVAARLHGREWSS